MIPDEQVDELLKRAYVLSADAQRNNLGARVEIHLSKTLADRLRDRIKAERESRPDAFGIVTPTWLWGFPAERHDDWGITRVEVHTITTVR